MIPILFSSFHPNEPENHMNLVSNYGGGGGGTPFLFLALTTTVVNSDWDSGRKSSHSFKLGENMTFISLTAAAPDCRELLTSDLSTVVDIIQSNRVSDSQGVFCLIYLCWGLLLTNR